MKKDIIEIDFFSQIEAREQGESDCSCDGSCDENCPCSCHAKIDEGKESIAFSIKVIAALSAKCEQHNEDKENAPVNLEELKKAYCRGASGILLSGQTRGELAMARVNLLLRIKSRKFEDILNEKKEEKKLSGLIFDNGEDSILNSEALDMFGSWSPRERDFDKAKEDIEKYSLNYDFKNIDELYLNEYENLPLNYD